MNFVKNLLRAIPLAIGAVLTLLSAVYGLNAVEGQTDGVTALILGVIGIPLTYASLMALPRDPQ
jgi:hypothetical protein